MKLGPHDDWNAEVQRFVERSRAHNAREAREQRGRFWYLVFLTCVAVALFGYAFAP